MVFFSVRKICDDFYGIVCCRRIGMHLWRELRFFCARLGSFLQFLMRNYFITRIKPDKFSCLVVQTILYQILQQKLSIIHITLLYLMRLFAVVLCGYCLLANGQHSMCKMRPAELVPGSPSVNWPNDMIPGALC